MPLHSLTSLPGGVLLGRWHLLEVPAALWPLLADAAAYAPLLPARAAGPRQAQWLAGRVLVQHLLRVGGYPGRPLRNDAATGRPYLAGPAAPPAVSLSHAGEWVLALLAPPGTLLGLDVEAVRDQARRIAPKFLTAAELAAVADFTAPGAAFAAEPARLYSLLWSAKETLFKLAGRPGIIFRENLLLDLPAGQLGESGSLPARLWLDGRETRHHICFSAPEPGYILTYCVGYPSGRQPSSSY